MYSILYTHTHSDKVVIMTTQMVRACKANSFPYIQKRGGLALVCFPHFKCGQTKRKKNTNEAVKNSGGCLFFYSVVSTLSRETPIHLEQIYKKQSFKDQLAPSYTLIVYLWAFKKALLYITSINGVCTCIQNQGSGNAQSSHSNKQSKLDKVTQSPSVNKHHVGVCIHFGLN